MPRQFTLTNGIRVLLLPEPDKPYGALAVGFHHGPAFEPAGKRGLAHLSEHVLFRACRRYPTWLELSSAFGEIGDGLDASTEKTTIVFSTVFLTPRQLRRAVSLLLDVIMAPAITEDHLRRERARIGDEIRDAQDDASDVADQELDELLLVGDPRSRPILGSIEEIALHTTLDVHSVHRSMVMGKRMVIAVAGRFDPIAAEENIRRRFARIPHGTARPTFAYHSGQRRRSVVVHREPRGQVTCKIGFRTVGLLHPLRIPLAVLNRHLSGDRASVFHQALLDRGMTYAIDNSVWHYRDVGLFWISASTGPDRVLPVLDRIMTEIRRLRTDLIPERALRHAQRQLRFATYSRFLDPFESATFYARLMVEHGGEVMGTNAFLRAAAAVTRHDLRRAARATFHANQMAAIFSGPTNGLPKQEIESVLRCR